LQTIRKMCERFGKSVILIINIKYVTGCACEPAETRVFMKLVLAIIQVGRCHPPGLRYLSIT
jgi:hypothetical protein